MDDFKRAEFKLALRKLRRGLNKLEWSNFISENGYTWAKFSHLCHIIQIIKLFNHRRVRSSQLIKPAKWLKRHNYGRFSITSNLAVRIKLGPNDGLNGVELLYNYRALPYIKFIQNHTKITPPYVRHMIQMESKSS
jgi:hypothetical protein